MKIASLLAALGTMAALAGSAHAASALPRTCGVVPAAAKKWYLTMDGASCATAKSVLAAIAGKARGTGNVTVNLGTHAGMKCTYVVFSGNAGINCSSASRFMRASWVR